MSAQPEKQKQPKQAKQPKVKQPKQAKGPLAQIRFNPQNLSAFLAVLANSQHVQCSYFIEDEVKEVEYQLDEDKVEGFLQVAQKLDKDVDSELLTKLMPLCYNNYDEEALKGIVSTVDASKLFYITESPKVQEHQPEFLKEQLSNVSGQIKAARGQVSVALKKYEQQHNRSTSPTLQNAVDGHVKTRFPPEPSGYLHIGHSKAAILNDYFARKYHGKLLFRIDDTNPAKENPEFVENIKADLGRLGIHPDEYSYTSDHFDEFIEFCKRMIKEGRAYADQTPQEQMQKERFDGIESKFRNTPVEENLRLFDEMLRGTEEGLKTCIRAKAEMQNPNKCMRDFVIYRCVKDAQHWRFGDKYKAYPTYDFACPIVDSIEGVTHALRTTEYNDRAEQYRWVCHQLNLRVPELQEFSRLNMQYSIMSKRNLQWFVDNGKVESWQDPRFPTIQGMIRRGLLISSLREFIIEQGASRRVNYQEWSKLWSLNKQKLEPVAKRFHCVLDGFKKVDLIDVTPEVRTIQLHPKHKEIGTTQKLFGNEILISPNDYADFEKMKEGDKVTLMGWGNFKITADKKLQYLEGDNDFSKTLKLTWIPNEKQQEVELRYFGQLVTKAILEEGDDFRNFVNPNSLRQFKAFVDSHFIENVKKGDIIQLERMGFYYVDQLEGKIVLNYINEGKLKSQVGAFTFDEE